MNRLTYLRAKEITLKYWEGGGPKGQCVTNLLPIVDNLCIRPFLNMNNFSYNIY